MRHPLHPALVHFPIACWSLATLADLAHVASVFDGDGAWQFAVASMAIGLAAALAAMATGLLEFVRLAKDHPAEATVQRHMAWALAAWSCYAVSLFLRMQGVQPIPPALPALGFSLLGFGALAVAGWLGGTLVYTHRVGPR